MMAPRGDEQLRRLIADYFGAAARLRQLRATAAFGAPVFVVDFDRGARHYRTLGSFGPSFGTATPDEPQVTEQSSMDLLYPAHLVFHYERLMSLAFAPARRRGCRDVALYARLPAGMRRDDGRCRRSGGGGRRALVLFEPAGRRR